MIFISENDAIETTLGLEALAMHQESVVSSTLLTRRYNKLAMSCAGTVNHWPTAVPTLG